MSRISYDALTALQAITETGSFERAARKLHITQSAVSQRLRSLEEHLGQLLLVRDTPPRPTRTGRLLLNHAAQVQDWEQKVLDSLQHEIQPEFASLAIGVNADSLATWFLDSVIPAVKNEKLLIELIVEDEQYTDELLRRGEVSGTISAQPRPPLGCESIALGTIRYHCVATPKFRDIYFPRGFSRKAIEDAPTVLFNRKDSLHARFLREQFGWQDIAFPFSLIPSSSGFASWIESGLAYGLVPEAQCKSSLKKALLVNLTPHKSMEFDLYYHSFRLQPPFLEQFQRRFVKKAQELLRAK